MSNISRKILISALIASAAATAQAQIVKPKLELTPSVAATSVPPGSSVKASLKVHLPQNVHVQSDKPRNPAFIPTVLKVDAPAGVTVGKITFPPARDLTQAGQSEPLAVFGPDFTIDVELKLAPDAAAGDLQVPAHLRYQACDEAVCYPPSKADTQWTLHVASSK
jgi:thiol:disulfide interchange protein DsbD